MDAILRMLPIHQATARSEQHSSVRSQGQQPRSFKAIAVVGDTEGPIAPCGVCRQVLVELCEPDMKVIMGNLNGDLHETTVAELLPWAFGPSDLDFAKNKLFQA